MLLIFVCLPWHKVLWKAGTWWGGTWESPTLPFLRRIKVSCNDGSPAVFTYWEGLGALQLVIEMVKWAGFVPFKMKLRSQQQFCSASWFSKVCSRLVVETKDHQIPHFPSSEHSQEGLISFVLHFPVWFILFSVNNKFKKSKGFLQPYVSTGHLGLLPPFLSLLVVSHCWSRMWNFVDR